MGKRFHFDTHLAIRTAWDVLWASRLKERADGRDFRGSSYYVTASDVEDLVRQFASDTAKGRPWRTKTVNGDHYGIRMPGDLNGAVRDYLLRGNGGKIVGHNFGRGHISGMRFRPVGEPIGPAEKETIERKARNKDKPKVRHFGKGFGSHPHCVVEAKKKAGKRFFGWRRSKSWVTSEREEVTCPRCLNLLKSEPVCEAVGENHVHD